MVLDRILWRLIEGDEVDFFGSREGPVAGYCEHGDERSGSGATELVIHSMESKLVVLNNTPNKKSETIAGSVAETLEDHDLLT
jgi:hypothetical protein